MSQKTVNELQDVAQWYAHHRDQPMSLEKRVEFLMKANDMLTWVLAQAVQDIVNLEARRKVEDRFSGFFLPRGLTIPDGVRRGN